MSEFELKLMDIESEHLGIPDTEYKCTVRLPAAEFQRIIRGTAILLLLVQPHLENLKAISAYLCKCHRDIREIMNVLFYQRRPRRFG